MGNLKLKAVLCALTATAALSSTGAMAQSAPGRTQSGSSGGLSWTAESRIVGMTSTATVVAGGNPIFLPSYPKHSGTVALIMDYGAAGAFICSGSLMADRRSILTAAHCVSDGSYDRPLTTTAWFYGGPNDIVVPFNAASTSMEVANIFVHQDYTGEVIDQNDIAVLRLGEKAPDWATSYELYDGTDLTGLDFDVAGYGGRSDTGGTLGANLGTGRLRQGQNMYDFRFGDARFNGAWDAILGGTAEYDYSYLSDFDSGLAVNDMSCRVSQASNFGGGPGLDFCDLGRGALEVGVAGGDSGGPEFIDGKVASVTSYGLTFGTGFGDCRPGLNSSCGEFSGYVPVHIHRDFIANAVPEPTTWAMMIGGFGLVGGALRRRAKVNVSYA